MTEGVKHAVKHVRVLVNVRMSPEQKAALQARAFAVGVSMSELVRNVAGKGCPRCAGIPDWRLNSARVKTDPDPKTTANKMPF